MNPRWLLVLVLFVSPASAQEPLRLSLDDAISVALADGFQARDILLQLERAQELQRAAEGRFKTNADLFLTSPDFAERFEEAINPDDGSTFYVSRRRTEWSGLLSVNQPLPTNGTLSLRGQLDQIDTEVLDSDVASTSNFFTSVSLNLDQPLFVPNSLKLGRERADLDLERAQMQYTRTQLDVIYSVTDAFFTFYRAQRRAQIAQAEQEQQERSYNLAKTKFDAGLIPEVEALQMEVDLAQSRAARLSARGAAERAEEAFKIVLGVDLDRAVAVDVELTLQDFEVDEGLAIEHGLQNRSEIREGQIETRLAEITVEEVDARRTIRGDISAFYDLVGTSDPGLGFGASTRDLFDSAWEDLRERPNNKGLGFSLTVPLWDSGVNGSEVSAARLSLDRSSHRAEEDRRQVIQQIRAAITRLRDARGQLDVLARSEEVAQRSYDISLARFENGEITTTDLALDRDRLTQAKLAYLDAYIAFQLASADLERQTLYDFAEGRSLVD